MAKNEIKGLLIDLDGVLYIEGKVISGAVETVKWLHENDIPFRYVTNTTMRSRTALVEKLNGFGFPAEPEEVFSTCVVAAKWLEQKGYRRLHLMLPEEPQRDFSEFDLADENVDAVVVGDLGEGFNHATMNRAFRLLKAGADLVALQKNRFWQTEEGLEMDVGAWVAALEYGADVEATVIGKPNRAYFEMAVQDMNLSPDNIAMIGDDIHSDMAGGEAAGLKTIFVTTGKSQFEDIDKAGVEPDWTVDSIADIREILK